VPPLSRAAGVPGPVLFTAAPTGVAAALIALLVVDPPRPGPSAGRQAAPAGSPYRTPTLWRVHAASALLVWPQFTIGAFGVVFLVYAQHLTPTDAGRVMAVGQVVAVLMRIGVGRWSDHVGSRLRPVRQLGAATATVMAALAACAIWSITAWIADPLLILACGLTSSDNGLAFTSVAELAGVGWSGRALGAQNTGQNLVASITPPVVGALIGAAGYAPAFLLAALVAVAAVPVTPIPEAGPGLARRPTDSIR
jgi:predicted MFS family arabinose efflux permease